MIYNHAQDHPKVDYTKLPHWDDLQPCSGSSKSGLYKTFTLGRFTSMLRIIQKWIIQNFHLWMICRHAQNHPKVDCTKHPILNDFTFIQNWTIQNIQFRKMHNHPKVDHTKLPLLDDLQAHTESSKSGLYKTSNFGWLRNMFTFIQ